MRLERPTTASRPANVRSRVTNRPQKMVLDGRSELGRRVRDLADSYAHQLGGWSVLTDFQVTAVRRAAELTTLAEKARRDALRDGASVDPVAFARLEGFAMRAVRSLSIPKDAHGRRPVLEIRPEPFATVDEDDT